MPRDNPPPGPSPGPFGNFAVVITGAIVAVIGLVIWSSVAHEFRHEPQQIVVAFEWLLSFGGIVAVAIGLLSLLARFVGHDRPRVLLTPILLIVVGLSIYVHSVWSILALLLIAVLVALHD